MFTDFGSIITAVITPFSPDGSVDHQEFRRILQHLASHGSSGVVISGTTGESPTLSDDEKLACLETAVDEVGDLLAIIMGTGSNDTAHSEQLTSRACASGADGVLVVSPYYNNPPREGLKAHFTAVAHAAGETPVMLYNVPSRSVVNLAPDLVAELFELLPNVVALKQANPDLEQFKTIRRLVPDLAVYAGNDNTLYSMLAGGAVGVVGVATHLIGDQMRNVVDLMIKGDETGALEVYRSLSDVIDTVNTLTTNPIPIKTAMSELGFGSGALRLPLVSASEDQKNDVRQMLERNRLVATHA